MNLFIDGQFIPSVTNQKIDVLNPATGAVIDSVPCGSAEDADRAVISAENAFQQWRKVPMIERVRLQHAAAAALRERADEFAALLNQELGRPIAGCRREMLRSADLLDYYAEEGLRLRGEMPLTNDPHTRLFVTKEPVGVVVAITPFNYPITLLCFKLGAALITGCTVVAKPSEETPLTTLLLAELFHSVGYPAGTFNVVTGYGREIGAALVTHPVPRKVAFTGSTAAGKAIGKLAMDTTKRLTLEMGGQSPAIVCADADLEKAIPAMVRHAYSNSGQFCYRVNRIYVERAVYNAFVQEFARQAGALTVGFSAECKLGPLINKAGYDKSRAQIDDAIAKGATLLTGGERLNDPQFASGYFLPATVLADTNHTMQIMTEETFGPVVGIMPFDDLDEAVRLANDTCYGLAGYVFTRDTGRGLRLAESIEAGSVWINDIQRSSSLVPFGGMKESGIGREKSRHALDEYLEMKSIYLTGA